MWECVVKKRFSEIKCGNFLLFLIFSRVASTDDGTRRKLYLRPSSSSAPTNESSVLSLRAELASFLSAAAAANGTLAGAVTGAVGVREAVCAVSLT